MSEGYTEAGGVEGGTQPVSPTAEQGDAMQGNPEVSQETAPADGGPVNPAEPQGDAPGPDAATPDEGSSDDVEEVAYDDSKPEWVVETHGEPPAGREGEYNVIR